MPVPIPESVYAPVTNAEFAETLEEPAAFRTVCGTGFTGASAYVTTPSIVDDAIVTLPLDVSTHGTPSLKVKPLRFIGLVEPIAVGVKFQVDEHT